MLGYSPHGHSVAQDTVLGAVPGPLVDLEKSHLSELNLVIQLYYSRNQH